MTSADTVSPTGPYVLTLTCRVRAGGDQEFRAWLSTADATAAEADGLLGMQLRSEEGEGYRDWTAVYKFDSEQSRDRWADSDRRTAAMSAAPEVLAGPPSEVRSQEGATEYAREIVLAEVDERHMSDYESARQALDKAVAAYPGFVAIDHYQPETGGSAWTTVLTFQTTADLERWRQSDQRRELVAAIHQVAADTDRVVPTGFGQWFSVNASATAQTPAWKQAMVVVAVLYAMVSVLDITLGNAIGKGLSVEGQQVYTGLGLPFPVVVFIGNAVGTALLTWVLMPIVTRLMAWWLDPAAKPARTVQGVILLLVIYALEMLLFTTIFNTWQF